MTLFLASDCLEEKGAMKLSFVLLLVAGLLFPQQAAFDVASIKPTTHKRDANGFSQNDDPQIPSPGRLFVINNSLAELIRWAYRLKDHQLEGPNWLDDDSASFDIQAKAAPETTKAQMRVLLQSLLQSRFHLAFHWQTKILPIYELSVAGGGPKLPGPRPGAKLGIQNMSSLYVRITADNTTMPSLTDALAYRLRRPVVDKTGIRDAFSVNLEYSDKPDDVSHPSVFAALQEKLGLRLTAAKGPVEVFVVDHIDKRPTDN
jgi:bla regulator protein BlaR1